MSYIFELAIQNVQLQCLGFNTCLGACLCNKLHRILCRNISISDTENVSYFYKGEY